MKEIKKERKQRVNLTDKDIEQKWIELEDVLFDEDEDGSLFLASDWWIFEKGTYREEGIWRWFDDHHSKGVGWLLYEFEE